MVTASDGMALGGELWLRGVGEMLLPLVADLNALLAARPRDFPDAGAPPSPTAHPHQAPTCTPHTSFTSNLCGCCRLQAPHQVSRCGF